MNKFILFATAALGALVAIPASAATVVDCNNQGGNACSPANVNVTLTKADDQGTVFGQTVGSGNLQLTFTGNELLDANAGAASITGGTDGNLNRLTFTLLGGTFTSALFNLSPLTGNQQSATFASFTFSDGTFTVSPIALSGMGSNFVGIQDGAPGIFSVTLTTVGNFRAFQGLQLGGIVPTAAPAVPEPSTWAIMMLGFGFVGGAMRSAKRRQKVTLSFA